MEQRKIRDLMKEQLELVKTEKELKEMIDKINLSLNQLLVEQLQLKANNIIIEPNLEPTTSTKQETTTVADNNIQPSINSQTLNLNLSTKIKTFDGEEEEEEEDDEDEDFILS